VVCKYAAETCGFDAGPYYRHRSTCFTATAKEHKGDAKLKPPKLL
jgi:hypothetical protein